MKKLFWIVLFGAMVIGILGAQDFGFQNTAPNFSLNSLGFNTGLQLDLLAGGGREPIISSPFLAGLTNIPLGLWSWMNQDWLGGSITAGAEVGGYVLFFLATRGTFSSGGALFGGFALFLGGMIYGYVRGSGQCKQMNAALAWTGNPMNHITATALPTPEGALAGSLTFRATF
jgi:hypothetical protein